MKSQTKTPYCNSLISVSNKGGLLDFVRPLVGAGMRIVSTGGTARFLKTHGISLVEVSEQTGFPELMGGRVKSLHPHIYLPLLARLNNLEDQKTLKQMGLMPFDLVVCNLYPFEEKWREQKTPNLIELIDIGGPSILRASAKNFESITTLCDPADYPKALKAKPTLAQRKRLAAKVFTKLTNYNSHIADWLSKGKACSKEKPQGQNLKPSQPQVAKLDSTITPFIKTLEQSLLPGNSQLQKDQTQKNQPEIKNLQKLSYGENPHQKASWLKWGERGLHKAIKVQGKALSYNNICDLNSAVACIREFKKPTAVAIKHNNPCGVACDNTIEKALEKALKADPLSVFGGVLALNQTVTVDTAKQLVSLFLSAVIAPDYHKLALPILAKKKNLCILKWPSMAKPNKDKIILRSVEGGCLIQEPLQEPLQEPQKQPQQNSPPEQGWQYLGKTPNPATKEDLLMAWRVVGHLKSNAISLVFKGQTVGLGMGDVSRVSAVNSAIQRWQQFHPQVLSPVLASDGFFPFPDSIEAGAKAGIKWIIQPGGSIKDQQVIAKAKALGINMILTGKRKFLH